MKTKKHLLLIRFSSMGDVILHTSVLNAIKYTYGDSVKISVLTSKGFALIFENHPNVDQVIAFERGKGLKATLSLVKQIKQLNKTDPIHCIVDLHSSLRTNIIKTLCIEIPKISTDKRRLEKFFIINTKINFLGDRILSFQASKDDKKPTPQPIRNILDLSKIIHFKEDLNNRKKFSSFVSKNVSYREDINNDMVNSIAETYQDSSSLKEIQEIIGDEINLNKVISFAPVGNYENKRWKISSYIELIKLFLKDSNYIEYQFLIIAGPNDHYCEEFREFVLENKDRVFNFYKLISLSQSYYLIKKSKLVIGNDTGFTHAAEALGVPALMLLGPTIEDVGLYPHLTASRNISKKIWCRPCSDNGSRKCIRKEVYCMNMIKAHEVKKTADLMMEIS